MLIEGPLQILIPRNGNTPATVVTVVNADGTLSESLPETITGTTNATSFTVTNNTATTASVQKVVANGLTTGTGLAASSTGTIVSGGQLFSLTANSATTGNVETLVGNGITTGNISAMSSTSTAYTSGHILSATVTSSGTLAARTGSTIHAVTSMTHTANADVTQNFNDLNVQRTVIRNTGGTDTHTTTSQGAIINVGNTITATTGTITDTVKGVAITMSANGTGDGLNVTHSATGAISLNVSGASTTVDTALIAGTGAIASGKGVLRVTGSGATAAGGAILAVTATGTPAAATSYLAAFDYTGATFTNNPIGVLVSSAGTAAALKAVSTGAIASGTGVALVTSSGAIAAGGATLAVTATGTPAAATSYLANFDYTGATFTNNPIGVNIASAGTNNALNVTSSGAIASGKAVAQITATGAVAAGGAALSVTATGTPAAATSYLASFDYSGATQTNNPVTINVNAGASTGAVMSLATTGVTNTKFKKLLALANVTIWVSTDGTTPNGTLSGTAGDICFNGPSSRMFYCTGTTNWSASNV